MNQWTDLNGAWANVGATWSTIFGQEITFLRHQGTSTFGAPTVVPPQVIVVHPVEWPGSSFGNPGVSFALSTINFSRLTGASTFAALEVQGSTLIYWFTPPATKVRINPDNLHPRPDPRTAAWSRWFSSRSATKTVLLTGGTFTEVETPSPAQLAAADDYWRGGRMYQVDDDVAAALIAAGYTVTTEEVS